MNDLIKKLVEAYGPSGFEDGIRELIRAEVEGLVDEISVDTMGNLICRKRAAADSKNPLKVMIAAHMDEIGVMVSHITENGFLRFTNIGGVRPNSLLAGRVPFADGRIGVIGSDLVESNTSVHPLNKHFIDVGAGSREDCPVRVGDAAGFFRPLEVIGSRLVSKAMDDRIGCVIAIEALRRLPAEIPHDLYVVFTVQEEVGVRGAEAAANRILPDVGIALDVTLTGDCPEDRTMAVALGKGAAIKVKDSGMIAHAGLVRHMRQVAEAKGIKHQMEVLEGGSTDARSMQVAGLGAAAGCISIPTRYLHTTSEMVESADVEACVQLLTALLEQPMSL